MRVMAVVNEKLTERFDKIKNNIKWYDDLVKWW
jgi:hypothetical protein